MTAAGEARKNETGFLQAPLEEREEAALRDLFFSAFDGN
jgi:hypothetical protein